MEITLSRCSAEVQYSTSDRSAVDVGMCQFSNLGYALPSAAIHLMVTCQRMVEAGLRAKFTRPCPIVFHFEGVEYVSTRNMGAVALCKENIFEVKRWRWGCCMQKGKGTVARDHGF